MKDTEKTKEQLIGELAELRKQNAGLEQTNRMMGRVNDILISWDADGIVTYISPQVENYGFQPEEVISRNYYRLYLS